MSTILVTDATSFLGYSVVRQLILQQKGHTVMALVHNLDQSMSVRMAEAGVPLRQSGYNDYASLVAAFQGVDKLYFVSASDIFTNSGDIYRCEVQNENVLRAAQDAGVRHVFYTSYQRRADVSVSSEYLQVIGHSHAEQLLRESGMSYTILKHALYTELLPDLIGENVLETGTIFLPAGNGRATFVTGEDMAIAGAKLLLHTEPVAESYEIASLQSYSLADIAVILSELAGKPIQYVSPTEEEFVEQLAAAGEIPEGIYSALALCQTIAKDELDCPDPTLAQLLGRDPESVKERLKRAFKL